MKQALALWQQTGRISLWRYRKAPTMYAGWHFSADPDGCTDMHRLIELLLTESNPVYRTLTIADPRLARVDRIFGEHTLRVDVPTKLKLWNRARGAEPSINFSGEVCELTLGLDDLRSLSNAIDDVASGRADFGLSFGDDQTIVHFWWWPNGR